MKDSSLPCISPHPKLASSLQISLSWSWGTMSICYQCRIHSGPSSQYKDSSTCQPLTQMISSFTQWVHTGLLFWSSCITGFCPDYPFIVFGIFPLSISLNIFFDGNIQWFLSFSISQLPFCSISLYSAFLQVQIQKTILNKMTLLREISSQNLSLRHDNKTSPWKKLMHSITFVQIFFSRIFKKGITKKKWGELSCFFTWSQLMSWLAERDSKPNRVGQARLVSYRSSTKQSNQW